MSTIHTIFLTVSITKDRNNENVPHLEITGVILVNCNLVSTGYPQNSRVSIHLFWINSLVNYKIFYEKYIFLKIVSATFWLVCFVYLKESNLETRKNVFFFLPQKLFLFLRYSNFNFSDIDVMMSSNA